MSVFKNRRLLVGIATLVIVLAATAVIWGVPKVWKRNTSVKSQVTAYLLDDRGTVNGLLLASGDQLHFSPQTGAIVADQIKVGDEVSATGHAGTQTSYGREIKVEQIDANGRTIVEVHDGPPKHDHRPKDRGPMNHGPKDHADRERAPGPPDVSAPMTKPDEKAPSESPTAPAKDSQGAAPTTAPAAAPTPEITKVNGTIRAHLVNGHGDVDGLILSSGEQVRFSPKAGKLLVSAEQGSATQVILEGAAVRNERGVVIRPTVITVGTQTIALDR